MTERDKERGAPEFKSRNIQIKRMRDKGYRYREISEHFNIGVECIRQIVAQEIRNEKMDIDNLAENTCVIMKDRGKLV